MQYKTLKMLNFVLAAFGCKPRNYNTSLKDATSSIDPALAAEFEYLRKAVRTEIPTLESSLNLRSAYRARFGRNLEQLGGLASMALLYYRFFTPEVHYY